MEEMQLSIALFLAAAAGEANVAPLLPHADYVKTCISTGGMAGYMATGGTADLLQISGTPVSGATVRFVELSVLSDPGANTNVIWLPSTGTSMATGRATA